MAEEKGSDERLLEIDPDADRRIAEQLEIDNRRRAAEQANVDVQPEDSEG